jgi:dTDP-4-amino-4,6-dideoxygalactose transaminase
MVALQSAKVPRGEVITTPYSFVATSHIPKLLSLSPVFVDIRPEDFNIDPCAIEAAITPRTRAILPVHTYGFPCDSEAIDAIAKRHGLTVIYDAAHAFGVTKNGQSILRAGDFSALSFHATKVFNTFEGGAVVTSSVEAKLAVDRMKNFGFHDEITVKSVGGNAKMSEFNAALGLLQLNYFEAARAARRAVDLRYRQSLSGIDGIVCPDIPEGVNHNYSYFPILIKTDYPLSRDTLFERMRALGVMVRRYFYPLISTFPMYATAPNATPPNIPVATRVAQEILCLPIYPGLSQSDQARVIDLIISAR